MEVLVILRRDGSVEHGAQRPRLIELVSVMSAALVLLTSAPGIAHADTCTWLGGGPNNLWSTAANWGCDGAHLVPPNGGAVVFPTGVPQKQNVNDLANLIVLSVTIAEGYQLSGNRVFVNANVASTGSSDPSSVLLPLTVNQANVLRVAGARSPAAPPASSRTAAAR